MKYNARFEMGSRLFHLAQPDIYYEFAGLVNSLEEGETEYYMDTKKEHEPSGQYFVHGHMVRDVIAKAWVQAFAWKLSTNELTKDIKVVYEDAGSPKEYNYGGDWANFYLLISQKNYKALIESVIEEGIDDWLYNNYKSYDGFWSYMPDNLDEYMEQAECDKWRVSKERNGYALAQAIQYTLFRTDLEIGAWNDSLHYDVEEIEFSHDTFYFEPEEVQYGVTCMDCGKQAPDAQDCAAKFNGWFRDMGENKYCCARCAYVRDRRAEEEQKKKENKNLAKMRSKIVKFFANSITKLRRKYEEAIYR